MDTTRRTLLSLISTGFFVPPAHAQETLPTLRNARGQAVRFADPAPVGRQVLTGLDGRATPLERYHGVVLIVNFFATWCPPCRQELPALDALLQREPGLRAVAISVDREGARVVRPYLASLNLKRLPAFIDPEFRVARRADAATLQDPFRLFGLPLSYVLTPGGRNFGYVAGAMDWSSPAARALLDEANAAG
ncbi:MAG: TlpA disulfide reductase family protein [Beijerinckiaceae bacterium]|nr:TlpA disulfide reductase family protein [Beijerinckiaceae bacterium]MCZ8299233.1 TlpA disulfide reductase family protein [Beijerinckiaceae bacterium]